MTRNAQQLYYDTLSRAEERIGVPLELNRYEKFAELDLNVRDLLTPATAVSIAGLALVLDGITDLSKVSNVHKIAIGRGCDIFDGSLARFLNQSSDAGAAVDVIFDKYEMWRIGTAAWQQGALPKSLIGYTVAKNGLHAGLTIGAAIQHPHESFRPPKSGKYAMFGDNLAGGLMLYAHAYAHDRPDESRHTTLKRAGKAALAASLVTEIPALYTYLRRLDKDAELRTA